MVAVVVPPVVARTSTEPREGLVVPVVRQLSDPPWRLTVPTVLVAVVLVEPLEFPVRVAVVRPASVSLSEVFSVVPEAAVGSAGIKGTERPAGPAERT